MGWLRGRGLCGALRCGGERQREVEAGAVAKLAFSPDASAVSLHNVLDDGEAEAGAAGLARARLVDAIKALEDALEMLGGDAGAEVLNGELHLGGEQTRAGARCACRIWRT